LVKSILIDQPLINGIVLEEGSVNWDITSDPTAKSTEGSGVGETAIEEAPPSHDDKETEPSVDEAAGTAMAFSLQRLAIQEGRVYYEDHSSKLSASLEGFNLEMRGNFSLDQTELDLEVQIEHINAKQGGIRYMRDGTFTLDLIAAANMEENTYTLQKNEIALNGLVLGAEGMVSMLEDDAMDIDLRFFSRETSFQRLLSMVPAIYLKDFETLKTSGSLKLEGTVQGIMKDTILPDASLLLQVKDGYFSYPDLPKDVSDVQITLNVDYRGTDMDASTVDLKQFHLLLGGNPFDLRLQVDHPVSDMHVAGTAAGVIDFASLQDVVPLEDLELGGKLETDLRWDTRMSYIEQEKYEQVDLDGLLLINDVQVEASNIPVPVQLHKMLMDFNPRFVDLVTLDLNMGSSDLHLEGKLTNFIPYVFDDKTVAGSLRVTSQLLDANEFIPEEDAPQPKDSADMEEREFIEPAPPDSIAEPSRVKIPENIDFAMTLDMKKVVYDNIVIENILGNMKVSEGVAYLDELSLDVIEGEVTTSGKVDTRGDYADVDLSLDMTGVDIPKSYKTFVTVERLAPMARYCKGTANVKMQYQSRLDASFSPLYESINAKGYVFTRGLQIYNLKTFVRLSELLKNEKFRNLAPDEVDLVLTIEKGRVMIDPFDMDFDASKITVSGSHGIDLTMDYLMDMNIAKSDLGDGVNELMNGITALAAGAGFKIPESDYVKVKATIKGTFNDPQVSTDLRGNLQSTSETVIETIKETVEQKVTEEVEKVEEQVRKEASEEAEKIISEAEEEAEKLVEEARIAGDKLVKEAEIQGENLIKEAGSNPIKQIAAKRAAEELKIQAQKQSDNLVKEAEVGADEIIEKARTEAERIDK